MANNLFKKAKEEGTPKTAKPSKVEVVVNDSEMEDNIRELSEVNEELASLTARAADLTGQIKPFLIEEFVKLYNKEKKYPGSFNVRVGKASVMVIPTDKYLTIDEDRANTLKATYGPAVVEEKDTYILNTELVEKYGDIISNLITKCKEIKEEDKEKLISVKTVCTVKKGTISTVFDNFKKYTGSKLANIVDDIKPIFQMKNVKCEPKEEKKK